MGAEGRAPQLEVISVCRIPILVPPQAVTQYIRRGRGPTRSPRLAECQYVMEVGDVPLRVAYERLAGMVHMLGEDVQAMALHTPTPLTCSRRTPSLGAVSALQASMGSVSTLSSCTSAT